jgi:hypothetical protein
MYVEYNSNNSGGQWWLSDQNWKDLEAAGWKVSWARLEHEYNDEGNHVYETDGTPRLVPHGLGNSRFGSWAKVDEHGDYRYMGALARAAYRTDLGLREAAEEWEKVTGLSSTDPGCPCCGKPHNFTLYDDKGHMVDSGPHVSYDASW